MLNIDRDVYDNMRRVLRSAGQLEQVTESFCSNSLERISSILQAINDRDIQKMSGVAHALKGSCAMFGARGCLDLCQQLENACQDTGTDSDYEQLIRITLTLQDEIKDVINFIRCQDSPGRPGCCP